jgi:uncharacterized protein
VGSEQVEVLFTKWGGARHWEFTLDHLGTDRWGLWLGGRAGLQLHRGGEPFSVQAADFVLLAPAEGCWVASWNAEAPDSVIDVYVDVTTRPEIGDGVVRAVDLDLDVVRLHDGRVELADEDEFAVHQVQLGYPPQIVEQARATADQLVAAVRAGAEPFGKVGAAWLARFTANS